MRSSIEKGGKKLSSRSSRRSSGRPSSRKQAVAKSTRLKPATKSSPAGKARAQKALKTKVAKPKGKASASAAVKTARKVVPTRKAAKVSGRVAAPSKATPSKRKTGVINAPLALNLALKKPAPPQPPPQPTHDEAAALKAFEAAHKEFSRGHFAEARNLFRTLVERYPSVSEVTARSRTYLAVAESRLRTDMTLPRDADSLYDRGVIELNRGEYVAAQELFERALRREPEAAHIHYGLAATRARLGAIDTALKSLERALDLQPSLRIRAQRDQDLNPLRSDPDFEQLVFAARD
jgi:tetratricopeptide (TPR) repeat protein